MRFQVTRSEQVRLADEMRKCPAWWPSRRHANRFNLSHKLAESILERFEIPYYRQPEATEPDLFRVRQMAYWKKEGVKATAQIKREIAEVHAAAAKPFKSGRLEW